MRALAPEPMFVRSHGSYPKVFRASLNARHRPRPTPQQMPSLLKPPVFRLLQLRIKPHIPLHFETLDRQAFAVRRPALPQDDSGIKTNGTAYAAPPTTEDQRRTTALRSLAPPRQILFLLRRQLVDFNSHGLELQLGNSLVQLIGHWVIP